ncbi:MAG TPA: DUF4097 family beta strand repeat-containing protein [Candidatus Baltobacteraceae bacterium]|nr:DUF4097 family beta strand repeat-containing protein [Candidatus Baltobacteraceae bacterium]
MTASAGPISSIEHEIGAHGTLTLSIPFGTIQIHAVEGATARVRDVAQHDPLLRAEQAAGSLRVEMVHSRGLRWGRPPAPEMQVEVPAGARVEVDTTAAEVTVHGLLGEQRFRTVSGSIRLEQGAGAIDVTGVAGDVWVDAAGPLQARVRTVSGKVQLRAPAWRLLEVHTMSGAVHVEGRILPGAHRIETVSGDAALVGTTDMAAEASTLSGDITTDLPHTTSGGLGRRSMRLGGGDAKVTFRSMSGDLAILRGPVRPSPAESVEPRAAAAAADAEAARLRILEALEQGAIDVPEATRRLAELDRA